MAFLGLTSSVRYFCFAFFEEVKGIIYSIYIYLIDSKILFYMLSCLYNCHSNLFLYIF